MIAAGNPNVKGDEGIIRFKELISEELTKYSSSILLDPEYGLQLQNYATKTADF